MSDLARSLRWLCLILTIALAVRLAAAHWWQARLPDGQTFAFGDSDGYWRLGQAIAAGAPYQYGGPERRAFRRGADPPLRWSRAVHGGSGEIRTHERLPVAGFQDRCNRPLCHASGWVCRGRF